MGQCAAEDDKKAGAQGTLKPAKPPFLDAEVRALSHSDEPLSKIGELTSFSRRVYTIVKVVSKTPHREVTSKEDGSTHRVAEALVADDTGSVYMTLWDEAIDEVQEDSVLRLSNAYVNTFRGSMRLNLGRYGGYEVLAEAPFEELNLENNMSAKQMEYRRPGPARRGWDR
jgi:replication factor A1